jgi:hypothetical protein
LPHDPSKNCFTSSSETYTVREEESCSSIYIALQRPLVLEVTFKENQLGFTKCKIPGYIKHIREVEIIIAFHTFLSMLVQYTVRDTISFSSSVYTKTTFRLALLQSFQMLISVYLLTRGRNLGFTGKIAVFEGRTLTG